MEVFSVTQYQATYMPISHPSAGPAPAIHSVAHVAAARSTGSTKVTSHTTTTHVPRQSASVKTTVAHHAAPHFKTSRAVPGEKAF